MMGTSAERGQRGGVSRVLSKLDSSIESGFYYEAHQMYRTLYFRYTAQRKFDECLELLYSGALKLISKDQDTSATDLGLLLVETLEKRGSTEDGDLWIGRLVALIARINSIVTERETLINRAIKWSGDMSGNTLGHPDMHRNIGQIFWTENNYEQARHHFLLCRDGNQCGRILIKIHMMKGFNGEIDLFITQAVLQQLCLKDKETAKDTFVTYTTYHPHVQQKEPPFKLPLFNFLFFLFGCIEIKNLDSYRSLCELYKPSLNRDPAYEKYISKIAVLFLGALPTPPIAGSGIMGGMFGDLFSRLFQGFEDEDDLEGRDGGRIGRTHTNELD